MSDRFDIKEGDRLPTLRVQCLDGNGDPVDLSSATGKTFSMWHSATHIVKVSSGSCTIASATAGTVDYEWASGDTDTPGDYEGEVTVTFAASSSDPKTTTFPGDGFIGINVAPRIST